MIAEALKAGKRHVAQCLVSFPRVDCVIVLEIMLGSFHASDAVPFRLEDCFRARLANVSQSVATKSNSPMNFG
jgi:hypothetical protein